MENISIGLALIGLIVALVALIHSSSVKKTLLEKLDAVLSKQKSQPAQPQSAPKATVVEKVQETPKAEAPKVEIPKPEAPVSKKPEPEEAEISPELVAVITSAAFHALKRNVKVKKIRLFRPTDNSWSVAGRVSMMASHTVGKQS